ncbi:uncharacterized protein LY79DRAFT_31192 [Colletotrichum navitas]|uniref:Uncharacterized protein n=1 Tax=Colletotrichum navitas TaxID=681940 RepID=A0AAD8V757_9PEZI|nr:uncharacterized protein LY79DRAFT_31192 [Colletotrichum navitas]KAK1596792.1 hypothetical protein LY79DRAFT_31192 [Colletotrichum navitas]
MRLSRLKQRLDTPPRLYFEFVAQRGLNKRRGWPTHSQWRAVTVGRAFLVYVDQTDMDMSYTPTSCAPTNLSTAQRPPEQDTAKRPSCATQGLLAPMALLFTSWVVFQPAARCLPPVRLRRTCWQPRNIGSSMPAIAGTKVRGKQLPSSRLGRNRGFPSLQHTRPRMLWNEERKNGHVWGTGTGVPRRALTGCQCLKCGGKMRSRSFHGVVLVAGVGKLNARGAIVSARRPCPHRKHQAASHVHLRTYGGCIEIFVWRAWHQWLSTSSGCLLAVALLGTRDRQQGWPLSK